MSFPSLPEKILLALLICLSAAGFWRRFRNVVGIVSAAKPDSDFDPGSDPPAGGFRARGSAAGESDPPAPACGNCPCVRVLGILRLRAGHDQSHCGRFRPAFAVPLRRIRVVLFRLRRALCRSRCGLDRVPRGAPLHRPARLAGKGFPRIGHHRGVDLPPDGDLSGRPCASRERRRPGALCGGRTRWRCLFSCL